MFIGRWPVQAGENRRRQRFRALLDSDASPWPELDRPRLAFKTSDLSVLRVGLPAARRAGGAPFRCCGDQWGQACLASCSSSMSLPRWLANMGREAFWEVLIAQLQVMHVTREGGMANQRNRAQLPPFQARRPRRWRERSSSPVRWPTAGTDQHAFHRGQLVMRRSIGEA